MVFYADYCVMFAKGKKVFKEACSQLKVKIFFFTEEGDVNECLGIKF